MRGYILFKVIEPKYNREMKFYRRADCCTDESGNIYLLYEQGIYFASYGNWKSECLFEFPYYERPRRIFIKDNLFYILLKSDVGDIVRMFSLHNSFNPFNDDYDNCI